MFICPVTVVKKGSVEGSVARGTYFLERTARNPKVRFEIMAVVKPVQLKDRSDADAIPTPA